MEFHEISGYPSIIYFPPFSKKFYKEFEYDRTYDILRKWFLVMRREIKEKNITNSTTIPKAKKPKE